MKAKYLIVNADDFGLCPSINQASIEAFIKGCVTSLSIMPAGPYFREAVQLADKNHIRHMGIHLTLISEFSGLRWGPVSRKKDVPSLVDKQGAFHKTIDAFARQAKAFEVRKELESQIEKVIRHNIKPTHIDCHMFTLHYEVSQRKDFLPIILYLCKKYNLAFRSPFNREAYFLQKNGVKVLTSSFKETYYVPLKYKTNKYNSFIASIGSGVTEMILHCGYDNKELRFVTKYSKRRQADLDYALSPRTKCLLRDRGIRLISWKEAS